MVRIILADDHKLVRQGFRSILSSLTNVRIAAETGDGVEAVDLVEKIKPELLIVDLSLTGIDGIEVTARVTKRVPSTRVIILSMHSDEAYVVSALRSGALGYVLKEAESDELLQAVKMVLQGRQYLSSALPGEEIMRLMKSSSDAVEDRFDTLSSRERELLHVIAEGFSSQEIAERLFISPRTVDTHRSNIIAKLGLRSVSDIIRFAIERGLIPPRHAPRREAEAP